MRRVLAAMIGCVLAWSVGIAPAEAAGVHYVALGDSYSSGVGAGSYSAGSGDCLRSRRAYSRLWADAHKHVSYRSVACSGATTADVRHHQLAALHASTTLVSITIGGNDIDFAGVMETCVLDGTSACVAAVDKAEHTARTVLPGRLGHLYHLIREHAPHAHVVVLSYPRLYDVPASPCLGISDTSRAKINQGADVLDHVIAAAAHRHHFAFADVRWRFAHGHEICDGDASWLHDVDWSDLEQSYHPTATGQSHGYLPAFTAAAR